MYALLSGYGPSMTVPSVAATLTSSWECSVEGSGEVSGANGVDEPIGEGEAVFLEEAEDHELKSEAGLTALILEGGDLDRFRRRPTPTA